MKSLKVKYLETHLFLKNSAHCFKDLVLTNKLKEFLQLFVAFFITANNHSFGCHFYAQKFNSQLILQFFQGLLFNFNKILKNAVKFV